jgi:hypothetical protein
MSKKHLSIISLVGASLVLLVGSAMAQGPQPTPDMQLPDPGARQTGSIEPQQAGAANALVGTAISYQGQLQKDGSLHTGTCDFQFSLWDAATGGAQKGATIPKNGVSVANGLFSVEIDFGDHYLFTGDARYLQTSVQCSGDKGAVVLSPRQTLNAVPYALSLKPGAAIVWPEGDALIGKSVKGSGIDGYSVDRFGVYGESVNNVAGYFISPNTTALLGRSTAGAGVAGYSESRFGVYGQSTTWDGVHGRTVSGSGVYGVTTTGTGVYGEATGVGNGVFGGAETGVGGYFYSRNNHAVYAESTNGYAVYAAGRLRSSVVEIAGGSDLAERFSQADGTVAEPGTVMVIDADHPGHIKPSAWAYDRKVAGIVSGAGDIRPGLTLHQEGVVDGDTVMAIAGRVYVKAEALSGSIQPGDLLTTSDMAGYAMKASDDARSHGAVIGKAMTSLESGTGLVLVIVNLQ